jgi:5-methylcytosine-specific restriction endonuclease McrA
MARTIEQDRKIKREHMARKRARDPEAARAYARLDHSRNRDKRTAQMRDYYERRFFWGRAMKLRGPLRATTAQVSRLWYNQRGRCALTGRKMDRSAQLDHILPKVRGGNDSVENLQWVCEAANIAKRHMTEEEFTALCADVMSWIGRRIQQVVSSNVSVAA